MKLLAVARLYNRSRNRSAQNNILDLFNEPSYVKLSIFKYQEDIFGFPCSTFLLNDVQWHCQTFCENIFSQSLHTRDLLVIKTTLEMFNVFLFYRNRTWIVPYVVHRGWYSGVIHFNYDHWVRKELQMSLMICNIRPQMLKKCIYSCMHNCGCFECVCLVYIYLVVWHIYALRFYIVVQLLHAMAWNVENMWLLHPTNCFCSVQYI